MKDTIIINLPCCQYIGLLGNAGEHNTTELIFNLDNKLSQSDYINIEFENESCGKTIIDDLPIVDGQIKVLLNSDITVAPGRVQIQLIGYKLTDDGVISVIDKSEIIYGNIAPSIDGMSAEPVPSLSLIERLWAKVKKLWEMKHFHSNQDILDTITEDSLSGSLPVAYINDDGELIFEIGGDVTNAWINEQGELEVELS